MSRVWVRLKWMRMIFTVDVVTIEPYRSPWAWTSEDSGVSPVEKMGIYLSLCLCESASGDGRPLRVVNTFGVCVSPVWEVVEHVSFGLCLCKCASPDGRLLRAVNMLRDSVSPLKEVIGETSLGPCPCLCECTGGDGRALKVVDMRRDLVSPVCEVFEHVLLGLSLCERTSSDRRALKVVKTIKGRVGLCS